MPPSDTADENGAELPITVDYGLTIEEMIRAGSYHRVETNINAANFTVQGSGVEHCTAVLLDLERYITTRKAETEIVHRGLRPARLEELLAFGATYQDQHAIALGSSWVGPGRQRQVPAIFIYPETEYDDEHRDLVLTSADPDTQWLGVPFLAVRARG